MTADRRLKNYREIADQAERGERRTISVRVDAGLNTPGRIRAFVEAMETMGLTIEEWTIETFEAFYQKALRDARRKALGEAAEHLKRLRMHHADNELDCVSDDALAFAANEINALIEKEVKL
jgi:hypothetical protein